MKTFLLIGLVLVGLQLAVQAQDTSAVRTAHVVRPKKAVAALSDVNLYVNGKYIRLHNGSYGAVPFSGAEIDMAVRGWNTLHNKPVPVAKCACTDAETYWVVKIGFGKLAMENITKEEFETVTQKLKKVQPR